MEGSSTNNEEVKRTPTFYLYHPCFLLEEVVGGFFKCLGFEIGTKTKEDPSALEDDTITEEITPTNKHERSQSSEEQKCSITTQLFEFISNLVRRGPRIPDPSSGRNPEIN